MGKEKIIFYNSSQQGIDYSPLNPAECTILECSSVDYFIHNSYLTGINKDLAKKHVDALDENTCAEHDLKLKELFYSINSDPK